MAKEIKSSRKSYAARLRARVVESRTKHDAADALTSKESADASSPSMYTNDTKRELEFLRRENQRLTKEREILRCAVAHLSAKRSRDIDVAAQEKDGVASSCEVEDEDLKSH